MIKVHSKTLPFLLLVFLASTALVKAQDNSAVKDNVRTLLCFAPQIDPDVDEIKEASYISFFDEFTDYVGSYQHVKVLRLESPTDYEKPDQELLLKMCENNNGDFVIVPKIKFFKVGIGKYVFSSQVIVSLKLYDRSGNLIEETNHDTYKRNKRLLGSAENSIKIGTKGALKEMSKSFRKIRKT